MNKFYTLTQAAHAVINPYETDTVTKKKIAAQYAIPLMELHWFPTKQIPKTLQEFKDNIDLFLKVITDGFEHPDVKVRLLMCPINQGFENIAHSAQRQAPLPDSPDISGDFSAAGQPLPTIKELVTQVIDFNEVLDKLIKIAENTNEDMFVRMEALRVHSNIYAHAVTSFGLELEWQPYEDRITAIAVNSTNRGLTNVTLNIIDPITLTRNPSRP